MLLYENPPLVKIDDRETFCDTKICTFNFFHLLKEKSRNVLKAILTVISMCIKHFCILFKRSVEPFLRLQTFSA